MSLRLLANTNIAGPVGATTRRPTLWPRELQFLGRFRDIIMRSICDITIYARKSPFYLHKVVMVLMSFIVPCDIIDDILVGKHFPINNASPWADSPMPAPRVVWKAACALLI